MKKQLALGAALLSVIVVPTSIGAQGRIKCVDTPPGIEGDPDPDTYCPEDYGTDPRSRTTSTRGDATELQKLVAEAEAETTDQPK